MNKDISKIRICIIGAGPSGICMAKHLLSAGLKPIILERASVLGGTWVYTEKTGKDEYGLPVHSSMYKSLRTNLPKPTMSFAGFPIPEKKKSYPPAKDILEYIQNFANTFNVTEHIKFNHYVKLVKPQGKFWKILHLNLITNEDTDEQFDYVFVCNGHYNTPYTPYIQGLDTFKGEVLHSHDYRFPEAFANKRLLVIGAGFSGMDIAPELSTVAKKVLFSHHLKKRPNCVFRDNLKHTPDVKELIDNRAIFIDDTSEEIDTIIFCTGYSYSFPFLDPSCGIKVVENHVQPLYKQLVNIERPTMGFIGIPFHVNVFLMFDLQAQYYLKVIQGNFELPDKDKMYEMTRIECEKLKERGLSRRKMHFLGPIQGEYLDSLAEEASIERIPPVLTKINFASCENFFSDITTFRDHKFRIINDEEFVMEKENDI